MPTNSLRGDALALGQTTTHTVGGTPANLQVYTLTCNSKSVAYTATGTDTNNTIAAALQLLLSQAATIKEIQEATFTVTNNIITSNSATPGMPYTFTTGATGTGTFVTAITVAASGFAHADDPTNWTLGRIPAGECSPPVQANVSATSGGSLTNGTTYYWVITATNANGESLNSNEKSFAITTPNLTAVLTWAAVPGALGYKVYRSTSTGVYTTPALVTTLGNVLTYNDTGTAVGAGAPPGSNTAIGDDVFLNLSQTASGTGLLYGLPTDYLVWNSLTVDSGYIGQCGLPDQNKNGYYEYRQTHMKVSPKKVFFGTNGGGPQLFRVDKGTLTSTTWQVYCTGNPATTGLPALWIKGYHAGDTLFVQQGSISVDLDPGETGGFDNIEIGYLSAPATDVQLMLGAGCTLSTITQLGGVVSCWSNVTTLQITSGSQGTFSLNGTATMGTLTIDGGTYQPKTTGTHTTVNVNNGGTLDHTQDIRAFTVTNMTVSDGCTVKDPAGTMAFSNPIHPNGNPFQNMNLDFGTNPTVSFAP